MNKNNAPFYVEPIKDKIIYKYTSFFKDTKYYVYNFNHFKLLFLNVNIKKNSAYVDVLIHVYNI